MTRERGFAGAVAGADAMMVLDIEEPVECKTEGSSWDVPATVAQAQGWRAGRLDPGIAGASTESPTHERSS
ncbi:hypothetical protein GCM10009739_12690 [Microbacterium ulmi]